MSTAAWVDTTLSEIAEIVGGATPKTAGEDYWGGDVYWATPKDLSELDGAEISSTPRTLTQAGLRSCSAQVLPPGSVLLSSRAPIGHVAINTVPMATNQGFKSLVPHRDRVDAKFLYWWLRRNRPALEAMGTGATFKEISKRATSAVPIKLPPIEEQRRIAAILDAADALRAKRREALAKLDTLTQAIFIDMFGDGTTHGRMVTLQELVRDDDRINYGVVQPGPDVPGGVPLVRVGDLVAGRVSHEHVKRISPDIEDKYRRSRLRGDEVLISCVGSTGVVATAAEAEEGWNIARAIARVPLREDVERDYVVAALGTPDLRT